MPSRPPKKLGGKEANEVDTTTNMSRASAITFENTTQTIANLLKNEKVPNIWSATKEHKVIEEVLLGDSKHQVTTSAGKEDSTDSTATKTTATFTTFTSSCESNWDEYTVDGMMKPNALDHHACGFGKRRWQKPSRKWRTPTPQACARKNTPHKN